VISHVVSGRAGVAFYVEFETNVGRVVLVRAIT
jgi:hypothetical protein